VPEQALADLNVALAFRPNRAGARYWRGWLHQQQGRWQQAIADYTLILQAQPDEPQIHRLRDACRRALGKR
jgi:tetratricopeptide (TPR) repeat protein